MVSVQGTSAVGWVQVATTDNRGLTPEELADRAVERIIHVGDQSHPVIRDQARAFRDAIRQVRVHYLTEAVVQDRATIAQRLRQAGHPDLINFLGD